MLLTELIGNEHIKKILQKTFHAYLIEGEEGSGRHTLLRLMTAGFICSAPESRRPCMKCAQCRKFLSGNHPDVTYIDAEIKTEALRRVLSDIPYKPNEAEKRCFIIDRAEKMSVQTQNILLKTLEEPPEYAVFILLCSSKEGLLETVRSRCITLTLAPVTVQQVREVISRSEYDACSGEKKREALAFCDGYIGKAIKILNSDTDDAYKACADFSYALIKSDNAALFDICSFKKRDELAKFVDALRGYLAGHLRAVVLGDCSLLDEKVAAMGQQRLTALCSRLALISDAMKTNVNVSLWSVRLVRDCLAAYALKK
ncbi:MAG: ATP-binding protein [Eubacteriales bacterium]